MSARTLLAIAWRESRFGRRRLFLFLSAISLGVGALVAVQGFSDNLRAGVRDEARALVGADVVLDSRQAFGPRTTALLDSLASSGVPVARRVAFASMALLPRTGSTRLVQVRAPEPGYPFYGTVETRPAGAWSRLDGGRNAVVDPALLTTLGASIGDSISLGAVRFRVLAVIERVPGDAEIASAFAPRMYVPAAHVEATGLLAFGSRVEHTAFIRLPGEGAAERLVETHADVLTAERVRGDTAAGEQQDLEDAFGRLSSYMGLIGVLALLLGGIGVASAMSAYMARKVDAVAVLRCIGASAGQIFAIYLAQAAMMGLVGAAVGAAIGVAVQWVLPALAAGLLPVEVDTSVSAAAVGTGMAVGVWTAIAFAALPLLAVRRVSPLGALRRNVDPLPPAPADWPKRLVHAVLGTSAFLLIWLQTRDATVAAALLAGITATLIVLWALAAGLGSALRRIPRARLGHLTRQGIANVHRPGNQTRAVVVSLGFGVFLLCTLLLTEHNILLPLRAGDAGDRPNVLLWDVQDDQVAPLSDMLGALSHPIIERVPIVPMRVAAIDGRSVEEPPAAAGDGEDAQGWAVRREYRSTFRTGLGGAERVVRGELWSGAEAAPGQVSLEREIAEELGVDIGDRLTWDVQGVLISTRVTSIREVDWARFETNFFAVFPPAALEGAPRTWVLLTRAGSPDQRATLQTRVVRRFPNVAAIDLTLVQEALDEVIGRISAVIRFLGAFSVATGFVVLFGSVAAGRAQRVRESILLKTLGATRDQIARILLVEYLLLGTLSAVAGSVLALGAGWAMARGIFEVPFAVAPLQMAGLAAGVVALTAAVGLWASREVFSRTSLEGIREA